MKLEDQVCSLELAKRLKELGVKQESYAYWEQNSIGNYTLFADDEIHMQDWCSAFTVAELGELLPNFVGASQLECIKQNNNIWTCLYFERKGYVWSNEKEVDARARMLIHLLENKILEL